MKTRKTPPKTPAPPAAAIAEGNTRLGLYRQNPANPSKATAEEIERLAGKIRRNPAGLRAMRLAYVTDDPQGGRMVISGNKRLQVLKSVYGEDGEVPAEWFEDVTHTMNAEQRREFILTANISDGSWDYDLLLAQYDRESLLQVGFAAEILDSLTANLDDLVDMGEELGNREGKEVGESSSVLLHIPPEWMPTWRSYNRTVGSDRVIEFIGKELDEYKKREGK